jgi:hypothetical protein
MKKTLSEDELKLIESQLQHPLYYIEYPVNVTEDWWKDGEGKKQSMNDMGLDHLKAAIKMVEKNIEYLQNSYFPADVINELMPLVRQKLIQLRNIYSVKIKI